VPKCAEDALCMVNVLLCSFNWRTAISLQRQLSLQLGNHNKLQTILLERIFSWLLLHHVREKRNKDRDEVTSKVPSRNLSQELLQFPFTKAEKDCLEEFLKSVPESDKRLSLGSDETERAAVISLSFDILVGMNLLNYRISAANQYHNEESTGNQYSEDTSMINQVTNPHFRARETLLRYHNDTLVPYGMPKDSRFLSLLGTLSDSLPKTRMNFYDKLQHQRASDYDELPQTETTRNSTDMILLEDSASKKLLHVHEHINVKGFHGNNKDMATSDNISSKYNVMNDRVRNRIGNMRGFALPSAVLKEKEGSNQMMNSPAQWRTGANVKELKITHKQNLPKDSPTFYHPSKRGRIQV